MICAADRAGVSYCVGDSIYPSKDISLEVGQAPSAALARIPLELKILRV